MYKFIITVALVAVGAIAWYLISPLFITVSVDDAIPVAITNSPSPAIESEIEVLSGVERLSVSQRADMDAAMAEANKSPMSPMAEEQPTAVEAPATSYPVVDTAGHPADGTVRVIETAEGTVIRFEDFSTINGPQLHLYLAKDLAATEYLDLGPIRGTEGNINYLVPNDVDLSEYRYVMHWCVPFDILFNYVDLAG